MTRKDFEKKAILDADSPQRQPVLRGVRMHEGRERREGDEVKKHPRYATLRDFIDALVSGRERKSCNVVVWTPTGTVEIRTARGVVLFRSKTTETFLCDFAAAFGLKGTIS